MESKADQSSMLGGVDEEKGIVEAYVSVTGIEDNVGDIIEPGAYAKTLKTRTPKGVWSHRWEEPVSKTLAIKEVLPGDSSLPDKLPNGDPWPAEAGALYVKTQFNLDSDIGRRAFSNVKFFSDGTGPDTAAWSIGYKATKSSKDKKGVRHIKELDLYEYSPVLHGANSHAKTLSVKSLDEALTALHAGGYDTSELDIKAEDHGDGSLDRSEVKHLVQAMDILDAYLAEIGVKRAATADESDVDDDDGVGRLLSLSERLDEVLEADDFPELLDAAGAFDAAVQAGDDDAIAETVQQFLEVFEAEEADDPDDPEAWDGLRDVVADCLDDANELLYGIAPDDAAELDEFDDDDAEDDEAADVADEFDDDADYDDADFAGDDIADGGEDVDVDAGDADTGGDAGAGGEKTHRRGEVKSPSAAKRNRAESSGAAMSGGKYPIENASDLRKAIRMRGMGSTDSSAINAHIKKRARALGLTDMLPDDLKDGSGSDSSSGKKSADEPFTLPDLGWASAADDVFKAIDFGSARV